MDQMAGLGPMGQSLSQRPVRFEMAGRLRTCPMSRIEGRWDSLPHLGVS